MKVKLLKKLRREIPIRKSLEYEVRETETGEEITGRYVTSDNISKVDFYGDTLKDAIEQRRKQILLALQDYRKKHNRTYREVRL